MATALSFMVGTPFRRNTRPWPGPLPAWSPTSIPGPDEVLCLRSGVSCDPHPRNGQATLRVRCLRRQRVGWYLGRQVYRAHHDPELGGAPWGDFVAAREKGPRNPANMGSPYVPLDSWVYPAFDRLIATGYRAVRLPRNASVDSHAVRSPFGRRVLKGFVYDVEGGEAKQDQSVPG